jgi:hypothetical protein
LHRKINAERLSIHHPRSRNLNAEHTEQHQANTIPERFRNIEIQKAGSRGGTAAGY